MNIQTSQRKNALATGATDTTAHKPNDKPLYVPSYWERKDGYFKDGYFWLPEYTLCRNGEFVSPHDVTYAFPYDKAFQILIHLQAVSDDNFTLEVVSRKPIPAHEVSLNWEGKA